jgi:hypothetical protein
LLPNVLVQVDRSDSRVDILASIGGYMSICVAPDVIDPAGLRRLRGYQRNH